ncbi:MAG TPA: DUF1552 domain-containing protein [Nannocystaceae bacterium]|nr:DUF1552 domain-containing protein [Nannocystaceae bacterium]
MKRFALSRRAVLRGAGGIAIALPWLEIMGGGRRAQAADPGKRFVTVYQPGGSVIDNGAGENRWRPTGTENDFVLSPILAPLEPIKHKLLVMDGLGMHSAQGEQHQAGIIAWLTGTTQDGGGYSFGPSIDQVVASRISTANPMKSLQIAVRWGTGKSHGLLHPINCANFEDNDTFDPIPPRLDPQAIFTSLFGSLDPDNNADLAARIARKKSILDFVDRRYDSLSPRLGARDKQKIDEHLTKIRELEGSLDNMIVPTDICQLPPLVDTSDYNPTTGLDSADDGSIVNTETDQAIPQVGQFMMDMLVMALACDLTSVASLQWSDTEAKHTFPWLGLDQHQHFYEHDGNFRPVECEQIAVWYSEQHLYLLQAMDAVDMGGHTLLDESVVFFGSELAQPPTHTKDDMPFLLAGGGGGLRGGRFLRNDGIADASHNNLLVAILNLFGDERTTFGDPAFCTGAYSGLT